MLWLCKELQVRSYNDWLRDTADKSPSDMSDKSLVSLLAQLSELVSRPSLVTTTERSKILNAIYQVIHQKDLRLRHSVIGRETV